MGSHRTYFPPERLSASSHAVSVFPSIPSSGENPKGPDVVRKVPDVNMHHDRTSDMWTLSKFNTAIRILNTWLYAETACFL